MKQRQADAVAPAIWNGNFGVPIKLSPDDDGGGGTPAPAIDYDKLATAVAGKMQGSIDSLGEKVSSAQSLSGSKLDDWDKMKSQRDEVKVENRQLKEQVAEMQAKLEAAENAGSEAIARFQKAGKFKEALKNAGITDPDKVLKLSDFGDEQVDALKVTEDGNFEGFKETVEKYSAAYPEYFKPPEGTEAKKPQPQTPPAIDVTNSGKDFNPLSGANMEAVHNAAVEKLLKGK
jgi:hypothetical protein